MTAPDCVELSVACPPGIARAIAEAAIEARLAASANILVAASVYRWQGAVHHGDEDVIRFKTLAARLPALAALIRARHPYRLPAITWHPVTADAGTRAWIAAEATGEG